jgi:hypothetical protein
MKFGSFVTILFFSASGFMNMEAAEAAASLSFLSANSTNLFGLDWIEKNCQTQYTISAPCKTILNSNARSGIHSFQNSSKGLDEICPVCESDFESISPLPLNSTNVMCNLARGVYNLFPLICKQNSEGNYCLSTFASNMKKLNISSEHGLANFPCSVVDCCTFEALKLYESNATTLIINNLSKRCNVPVENQTCTKKSEQSLLPPAAIGVISGVLVVGGIGAAAGLFFWVKRRKSNRQEPLLMDAYQS